MDSFNVFKISASALDSQRKRINVIASNMANVHSTRTEDGGPYKRKDVVFEAIPVDAKEKFEGVGVSEIVVDNTLPLKVYDPGHPDADKEGYVTMPNINIIEEMVNMMMATRAYEANISAFNISKDLFMQTLEIGR
jgi:flagellar basal-body rod protein FlgC